MKHVEMSRFRGLHGGVPFLIVEERQLTEAFIVSENNGLLSFTPAGEVHSIFRADVGWGATNEDGRIRSVHVGDKSARLG